MQWGVSARDRRRVAMSLPRGAGCCFRVSVAGVKDAPLQLPADAVLPTPLRSDVRPLRVCCNMFIYALQLWAVSNVHTWGATGATADRLAARACRCLSLIGRGAAGTDGCDGGRNSLSGLSRVGMQMLEVDLPWTEYFKAWGVNWQFTLAT